MWWIKVIYIMVPYTFMIWLICFKFKTVCNGLYYIIFSRILKTVFYTVDFSENRKKIKNKGARLRGIKKVWFVVHLSSTLFFCVFFACLCSVLKHPIQIRKLDCSWNSADSFLHIKFFISHCFFLGYFVEWNICRK